MNTILAILALAATTLAAPQGVTQDISPSSSAPSGCETSRSGTFSITTVNVTSSSTKRELERRQAITLTLSLSDGKLTDSRQRTGYIAENRQFQFDAPPQTGAIYTDGFSVCSNGTLALGGSAIWYQCYSGGFYNLYDESIGDQCSPIYIEVLGGGASASQVSDGQPQASSAVSQITDGQPQATSAAVSQITDGQPQATSAAVSQIADGQPQATSAAVSQIGDGQPQAAPALSEMTDGQIIMPTGVVSQIGDGQPQAASATPVAQISDGQIQATSGAAQVSQISDGQIQATSAAAAVPSTTQAAVSQISDGQIQAGASNGTSNGTVSTATPVPFEGGAATLGSGVAGVVGLIAAVLAL